MAPSPAETSTLSTQLLAEYIDLPIAVHKTDFVVTLESGIAEPGRTVADYEATPQLVGCFDRALGMVSASIRDRRSMGAFLHGSFGSGKSHFMAVLDLILDGNSQARSIPELGSVITKYNPDLQGRKVLVVPFHFVDASSMEQIILGGYVRHIESKHPGAPTPRVYAADHLIDDAVAQRADIGDVGFFRSLSKANDGDDAWGDLGGSWDAARFDAAVASSDSKVRDALVSALLATIFSAIKKQAASTGSGFLPFEEGLEVVSAHAKSLGYDALVFFCDELVLWLAQRIAESGFVGREAQKLAKLVDANHTRRPAPIVSFIARQRDLRELVGDSHVGSEQQAVTDALKLWEGRFDRINFEDHNLPLIAQKRLLRPRSDAALLAIDDVFAKMRANMEGRKEFDVLLTDTASADDFRKLYPFSPALVGALVALSGVMQRDRTALKAMAQLLAQQRTTLRLGQLVPAGDLYDVITTGEDVLSPTMENQFRVAKRLWVEKFVPMLARNHGVSESDIIGLPDSLAPGHAAFTDSRIIKTLLIAALAPEVPSLRNLTAARLTALNSGTVKAFVPGAERQTVIAKVRAWAAEIGELKVGDHDHDPTVTLLLTGVDVSPIVDSVRSVDNRDLRRRFLRELLGTHMQINGDGLLGATVEVEWRGTKRKADVVFANVRDTDRVPDSMFRSGDVPKVIIDYPFDEDPLMGALDDLARVEDYVAHNDPQWGLCWLPNFFTASMETLLGEYVVHDYLLTGSTFDANAGHLPPADRDVARSTLANLRSAMRERLLAACKQAYGLSAADGSLITDGLSPAEQFTPLDASMASQPTAAPDFRGAIEDIVGRLWTLRAPKHPAYSALVTRAELVRTLDIVRRATVEPNRRLDNTERTQRGELHKIVQPLKLGTMGEAHIVLGEHWKDHFETQLGVHKPVPLTVGDLRRWIDLPDRLGLPNDHADLVIASFLAQTNRLMVLAGTVVKPEIGKLRDDAEIRSHALPSEAQWTLARANAADLGIAVASLVSPASVADLNLQLTAFVSPHAEVVRILVERLSQWSRELGLDKAGNARLATAQSAADLVATVLAKPNDAAATLATFVPASSFAAIGDSVRQSEAVVRALDTAGLRSIMPALTVAGTWQAQATSLGAQLRSILTIEEHAGPESLAVAVAKIHAAAQDLVAKAALAAPASVVPILVAAEAVPLPAVVVPAEVVSPVSHATASSVFTRADAVEALESLSTRLRSELGVKLTYQLTDIDRTAPATQ